MFVAGLPEESEAHAVNAVLAAMEILASAMEMSAAEGGMPWKLRVGLHSGPVVAGVVGVKKFAFDIWGDTVNLASRMESSGVPNRVNISAATYARVKDVIACEARGPIRTKDGRDLAMYFANGLAVQPVGSQTARFGTAFERPPGTL
jgi:class 3 adenylate cyclase